MAESRNLLSVQCLRALAALAVVGCHIGAMGEEYGVGYPAWLDFGRYGVDLFFAISGFIMVYTSFNRFGDAKAAAPFLFKRIFRIYPAYWEFSLLMLALVLLKPELMHSLGDRHPSIWKSFVLWPQGMDPLLGVGWTLVFEMYFYVIFCATFFLPKGREIWFFGAWAVVLIGLAMGHVSADAASPEVKLITSPLALEFIGGCMVAWMICKEIRVPAIALLGGAIVWLVAGLWFVPLENHGASAVLIFAVPAALLIYAAVEAEAIRPALFPRWLGHIGDASYSIYLSHSLLVSAFAKVGQKLGLAAHGWWGVVFFVGSIFGAIAFGMINYRLVERPVSRWYHKKAAASRARRKTAAGSFAA